MKVALYKMPYLKDCEHCAVFCADEDHPNWVRVSEVVDIDFQMIDVDWEAESKKTIQATADELEKRLAEIRSQL